MKRMLLTSAGFENPRIQHLFLALAGKDPAELRVLFIPTAAVDEEAKAVLPKCHGDLTGCGILEEHIVVYDLDRELSSRELSRYDAVYVCGGSPEYLLERVYKVRFDRPLKEFTDKGGIYIGVSAGSYIAAKNLSHGLGYAPCTLGVHLPMGSRPGPADLTANPYIPLTDRQVLLALGEDYTIFE